MQIKLRFTQRHGTPYYAPGMAQSHPCGVVAVQPPNPLFFQIIGYFSKNIAKKTKPSIFKNHHH